MNMLVVILAQTNFAYAYGGPSIDEAYSLIQTMDGGYALAGGTWSFGQGNYDVLVMKTDNAGAIEWSWVYGGSSEDRAYDIKQTLDGGYILVGWTYSYSHGIGDADILVMKLAPDGSLSWAKAYGGGSEDKAYGVAQLPDTGYVVAGRTRSYGNLGNYDAILLRLDPAGNLVWGRTYGGTAADYAYDVVATPDSGCAVVGGTASFGGAPDNVFLWRLRSNGLNQWVRVYAGDSVEYGWDIKEARSGGFFIAGRTNSVGGGLYDFLILCVDDTGAVNWARAVGGPDNDYAYSVYSTSDSGALLCGETWSYGAGLADFLLVKFDAGGNFSWARLFGDTMSDQLFAGLEDADGWYVIGGHSASYGQGGADAVLMKLGPGGDYPNCVLTSSPDITNISPSFSTASTLAACTPDVATISPADTGPALVDTAICPGGVGLPEEALSPPVLLVPVAGGLKVWAPRQTELHLYAPDGRLVRKVGLAPGETRLFLRQGVYLWRAGHFSGKAVVR